MTQEEINKAAEEWAGQYKGRYSMGGNAVYNVAKEAFKAGAEFTQPDWTFIKDGRLEGMPEEEVVVDVATPIGNIGNAIIRNVYRIRYWWYNEDGVKLIHIAPYAWKPAETPPPLKP